MVALWCKIKTLLSSWYYSCCVLPSYILTCRIISISVLHLTSEAENVTAAASEGSRAVGPECLKGAEGAGQLGMSGPYLASGDSLVTL